MISPKVPNAMQQERPAELNAEHRYGAKEIQGEPDHRQKSAKGVARIFNSAVMPYGDEFIGVFRGEQTNGIPYIYLGRSKDAIHWNFEENKINSLWTRTVSPSCRSTLYDPRLGEGGGYTCYIWCQDFYGAAIGMAKTDFKTFTESRIRSYRLTGMRCCSRTKIGGNYVSRDCPTAHTHRSAIFLSVRSPDLTYWGKHRHVMGKGSEWWESLKIGGGAAPIETSEGWLLFYHGVSGTCNGYVYSIGGAILDIDNPSIVKYRCETFLLTPEEWYEERGFVPNVCFPCATIHDSESGKIAIYYGAADSYVGLAFTELDDIIDYIKEHSVVTTTDTEIGKR